MSQAVNYLTEHDITSLEELKNFADTLGNDVDILRDSMKEKAERIKTLKDLLRYDASYQKLKPLFDEMNAIKWKGKREKFRTDHAEELRRFYMARRKLKECENTDGNYPTAAWKQEIAKLEHQRKAEYERFKSLRENLMELLKVKNCVDAVIHRQEEETRRTQEQNYAYYQPQQVQQRNETR